MFNEFIRFCCTFIIAMKKTYEFKICLKHGYYKRKIIAIELIFTRKEE